MDVELMELMKEFVKPEMLVLIPVLYVIGVAIKKATLISDKFIPLILGGIGIVLAVIWVLASTPVTGWQSGLMAVFTAITQGILCAGAAVYINQAAVVQPQKEE